MKREDLLPKTFEGKLVHIIEECGEVLLSYGKYTRFGAVATDPITNITYYNFSDLMSELNDLRDAINRVLSV